MRNFHASRRVSLSWGRRGAGWKARQGQVRRQTRIKDKARHTRTGSSFSRTTLTPSPVLYIRLQSQEYRNPALSVLRRSGRSACRNASSDDQPPIEVLLKPVRASRGGLGHCRTLVGIMGEGGIERDEEGGRSGGGRGRDRSRPQWEGMEDWKRRQPASAASQLFHWLPFCRVHQNKTHHHRVCVRTAGTHVLFLC